MRTEHFNYYLTHMNDSLYFISDFEKALGDRLLYIHCIEPNLKQFSFILVLMDSL